MMKNLTEDLALPVQGQVYGAAHSATAARRQIPDEWRGHIVEFTSDESRLRVLFGDATVAVDDAEVMVTVSEVGAANWGTAAIVPAGATRPFPVPTLDDRPDITHYAVDSSGANGYWEAHVASGNPASGAQLNLNKLGRPLLHLDAGVRKSLSVDAGAITVASWKCRERGFVFSEGSTKPDILSAVAASAEMMRPAVSFVAGSTEKLQCTDTDLCAALGNNNPFTMLIAWRHTDLGAAQTLLSVGTTATDNGRWDVSINATDDVVVTRVDSAGNSTNSTNTTNVTALMHTLLLTYDGTTLLAWLDGATLALTGLAAGDVGAVTKVTLGARAYNTSTVNQYTTAEISRVLVFPECFVTDKLAELQAFARRVSGV